MKKLAGMLRDESGQGVVEYALIIALVALVAIGVLAKLGDKASNTLSSAAAGLDSGMSVCPGNSCAH